MCLKGIFSRRLGNLAAPGVLPPWTKKCASTRSELQWGAWGPPVWSTLLAAYLLYWAREGGRGAASDPRLPLSHSLPCRMAQCTHPWLLVLFKWIAGGVLGEGMGVQWKKAATRLEQGYLLGTALLQAACVYRLVPKSSLGIYSRQVKLGASTALNIIA